MEVRAASPYESGKFAYEDGVQLNKNPYAKGTKPYRQWVAGWTDTYNANK